MTNSVLQCALHDNCVCTQQTCLTSTKTSKLHVQINSIENSYISVTNSAAFHNILHVLNRPISLVVLLHAVSCSIATYIQQVASIPTTKLV